MKIKILEIISSNNWGDCYCEDVIKGITDWEEATEEQFKKLTKWVKRKSTRNLAYIIARQSDFSVVQAIADIERLIDEEQVAAKKKKAAALKSIKTRAANKKAKQEEKDKEELKRLKELYDS